MNSNLQKVITFTGFLGNDQGMFAGFPGNQMNA